MRLSQAHRKIEVNGSEKTGVPVWFKSNFAKLKNKQALLALIIVVVAVVPSWYFYNRGRATQRHLTSPTSTVTDVVNSISRHIVLPSGEEPTLATVSDINKVKNQAFFAHAANGDKVLIYTQAREAILYRPSLDRLITVAQLSAGAIDTSGATAQ